MKLIFFCLFQFFLLGFTAMAQEDTNYILSNDYKRSGAAVTYDKFKDQTTITVVFNFGEVKIGFGWASNGNRVLKPQNMGMAIDGMSADSIDCLINSNQRLSLTLKDGAILLDSDTLSNFYTANLIEFRAGDNNFQFKKGTNLYDPGDANFKRLHYFLDYYYHFPDSY